MRVSDLALGKICSLTGRVIAADVREIKRTGRVYLSVTVRLLGDDEDIWVTTFNDLEYLAANMTPRGLIAFDGAPRIHYWKDGEKTREAIAIHAEKVIVLFGGEPRQEPKQEALDLGPRPPAYIGPATGPGQYGRGDEPNDELPF